MGRIQSGMGLVSGINHADIIDQLMKLEEQPKTALNQRIEQNKARQLAYTDMSTRLTGLKLISTALKKPSTFQAASAVSGNEDVLTATAAKAAATGSFQFQVARLVSSQQSVTAGFAASTAKVGAGTITMEMGGGDLSSQTLLSQLRGGEGIRRGNFRITDRGGNTAVIDTTNAVTLDDILKKINTSLDVSVKASFSGDSIVLTDLSGGAGTLSVQDLGGGFSAADLGLSTDSDASNNTLTGADINFLGENTTLAQLNDGRGVRLASSGNDLVINTRNNNTINVSLTGLKSVGEVIEAINTAGAGAITASIDPGGNGIKLVDNNGGGQPFTVTNAAGSSAATDLGLTATAAGGIITGNQVLADLNTVLISSLKGGAGLPLGTISIQDRAGASTTVDLSGATTVQDILDGISNATGVNVTARLNPSGNGIEIVDDTGATGNIVIGDGDANATATALGIAGTFDNTFQTVKGANLQRQWISETTLLSDMNAAKGIAAGKFKITNSAGLNKVIAITENDTTLGHVIAKINAAAIGVTASINANGDGLLLTDTAGGAMKLTVEDTEGTSAKDLRIVGESATGTTIDGSYEVSITVTATDTLTDVQKKINDANFGFSASIINDGSPLSPYRLSMTSRNAGRAGRVVFDAGATKLDARNLVESQDAAVFLGGTDAEQPLLVTSSTNQLKNVIQGVTVDLHGVSGQPVTLNITRDATDVAGQLEQFAEDFNGLADKIRELTKFDTETSERGLLLGQMTVQRVETELYAAVRGVVAGAGRYRILSDIGLRIGEGAKLEFDAEKFNAAFADDPDAVQNLFAMAETGLATVMESKFTKLIDPVDGVITRENKTIDDTNLQFQNRIESIDKSIIAKRERLQRQFAQMETVLAGLQNQQSALSQIQTIQPMSSRK